MQLRLTVPVYAGEVPGVTVMVELPDCPGELTVAAVDARLKVPAGGVTAVTVTSEKVLAFANVEPVAGVYAMVNAPDTPATRVFAGMVIMAVPSLNVSAAVV